MANIIDNTFFFGNLEIPQSSNSVVSTTLNRYIDEYEREYMLRMLGKVTYDNLTATPLVAMYANIINGINYNNRAGYPTRWRGLNFTLGVVKKSPIANYVYFHYMRDNATASTGSGEKVVAGQNSVATSPRRKMARAWNEMVDMNLELLEFLVTNRDIYTDFIKYYPWGAARYGGGIVGPYQGGGDGGYPYGYGFGGSDLSELITKVNSMF